MSSPNGDSSQTALNNTDEKRPTASDENNELNETSAESGSSPPSSIRRRGTAVNVVHESPGLVEKDSFVPLYPGTASTVTGANTAANGSGNGNGNGLGRRGTGASGRSGSGATGRNGHGPPQRKWTIESIKSVFKLKPKAHEPTYKESWMAIVKASWLNVLLIFVPVSWALHFAKVNDTAIFVTAFFAIIPLAKLLGTGTEEVALRTGETLGGLLNATLGNLIELLVGIIALFHCELDVVQASLIGSILSNLLLVLGMCFFAGGVRFSEQAFQLTNMQANTSLLVMSVVAVLIPAGFHAAFDDSLSDEVERDDVLKMSRGISVILLFVYGASLFFQLYTHVHLTAGPPPKPENDVDDPNQADANGEKVAAADIDGKKFGKHTFLRTAKSVKKHQGGTAIPKSVALAAEEEARKAAEEEDDDEEQPTMNLPSAVILLLVVAAIVGVTAEWLVDSINGLTEGGGISKAWVGLILLPIVGNAAEHVTAVTVSVKDKMDLSIGVAVGSSIQIALFVTPLTVIIAWIADKPLSLLFDGFVSITLFLAVLIVSYTVQDGKSNWLEGLLLMCVYLIVAVAFWFYPSAQTAESRLLACT